MTLSLDLRGVEASHALSHEARSKGASVSLVFHSAVVSTLVLIPLLKTTKLPEVAAAVAPPLPRAILVALPPAPLQRTPVRRTASATRPTQTAAVIPTTPTDTPTSLNLSPGIAFDLEPTQEIGEIGDPSGSADGTCPLGSLCGPAAVPLASPPPTLVRIGGLIREPRLRESRPPIYPSIAQAARAGGTVVLEARVGLDGRVKEARVIQGHTLFDESALASVRTRVYDPLLLNGVPTEFLVTITVTFNVR